MELSIARKMILKLENFCFFPKLEVIFFNNVILIFFNYFSTNYFLS